MIPLPVDDQIPEIVDSLRRTPSLVIEAPPGAGKTTRVPPALLSFGQVLVLEPRRLAARMAARRVAAERGETPGETVGFQVRFEEVAGPRTRLRFLTEGVLTGRMISDPRLEGIDVVVLDEFHERHIDGDLALALLKRLQRERELRIVVMSATLDGDSVAAFLDDCPRIRSQGRLFPVDVRYTPHSAAPLEQQVAQAVERLAREGVDGDILVFLPGAAEIRRAARACEAVARRAGLLVLPLHGDLSAEQQDRAVLPAPQPKLILSTNVAESSITIDGVSAVIDSGLARIARDNPWSGLACLDVGRISKASAEQRAGRAGRTRPGRVIRLYPAEDLARRPERDTPEIGRRELSGLLLALAAMGLDAGRLQWLDPPPPAAVQAAQELLIRLGALDGEGRLTPAGRRMARLPLHPRLSALVVEADRNGAGSEGCAAAAVLSAGERLPAAAPTHHGPSDLLALLESPLPPPTRRLREQILRAARPRPTTARGDDALLQAVLRAFPDRVARRRGNELLLAGGGSALLSASSVVQEQDWLVAVDIEERRERGLPLVRLASAIQPEWLLDFFPERMSERSELVWNRAAERVERLSALLYDGLVVEESRSAAPADGPAAAMLAAKARDAGLARFCDPLELDALLARVAFAARHGAVRTLGEQDIQDTLLELCQGCRSFAELEQACRNGGFPRALQRRLSDAERSALDRLAPERIALPRGRSVRVHYEAGKPPWIASRLQDFFGMRETPRVGGVALVVHLLAPNQRPVQMTTDLSGFWERLYPQLRRELSRRYPKHAWPENPF